MSSFTNNNPHSTSNSNSVSKRIKSDASIADDRKEEYKQFLKALEKYQAITHKAERFLHEEKQNSHFFNHNHESTFSRKEFQQSLEHTISEDEWFRRLFSFYRPSPKIIELIKKFNASGRDIDKLAYKPEMLERIENQIRDDFLYSEYLMKKLFADHAFIDQRWEKVQKEQEHLQRQGIHSLSEVENRMLYAQLSFVYLMNYALYHYPHKMNSDISSKTVRYQIQELVEILINDSFLLLTFSEKMKMVQDWLKQCQTTIAPETK